MKNLPRVGDEVYIPVGKKVWWIGKEDVVIGFGQIEQPKTTKSYPRIKCRCDDTFCNGVGGYGPEETTFYDLTGGRATIAGVQNIVPPGKRRPILCVRVDACGREKFWYFWDVLERCQDRLEELYGDKMASYETETVKSSQMSL